MQLFRLFMVTPVSPDGLCCEMFRHLCMVMKIFACLVIRYQQLQIIVLGLLDMIPQLCQLGVIRLTLSMVQMCY